MMYSDFERQTRPAQLMLTPRFSLFLVVLFFTVIFAAGIIPVRADIVNRVNMYDELLNQAESKTNSNTDEQLNEVARNIEDVKQRAIKQETDLYQEIKDNAQKPVDRDNNDILNSH